MFFGTLFKKLKAKKDKKKVKCHRDFLISKVYKITHSFNIPPPPTPPLFLILTDVETSVPRKTTNVEPGG